MGGTPDIVVAAKLPNLRDPLLSDGVGSSNVGAISDRAAFDCALPNLWELPLSLDEELLNVVGTEAPSERLKVDATGVC